MKKKSTAEYAETAEVFLGKDKKHKLFFGYGLLFAFQSSGIEDKRVSEEEAESAEIAPLKSIGRIDLRGRVEKRASFPLASRTWAFGISTSAFSATSAVKFFLFGFYLEFPI